MIDVTPQNPQKPISYSRRPAAPTAQQVAGPLALSWEVVAYGILLLVLLAVRFAELDVIAPRVGEVPNLLAAWRGQMSDSPLLYWAQRLGFGALGGTLIGGRLLTALAGLAVTLSPLLFRSELGRGRAFLLSLLLTVTPSLFIAARTSHAVIWTVLLAVLSLRLCLDAYQTGQRERWAAAFASLLCLALLTEASGPLLALLLLAVLLLALRWQHADAQSDPELADEEAADTPWQTLLAQRPLQALGLGLLAGGLAAFLVSTLFFAQPSGLSGVGGVLASTLALLTAPTPDAPLGALLFHMPLTLVLAGFGAWYAGRADWPLMDRFFALWAALSLPLMLLPGLSNAHGLLLALPACGLASGALAAAFLPDRSRSIWAQAEAEAGDELAAVFEPSTGRWLVAVIVLALLLMLGVHLQTVGREFLAVSDGSLSGFLARLQTNAVFADVRVSLLWSFIGGMFVLVGFFLAASIWGNCATLQGYGLGLLAFVMVAQLSAGWYVSVHRAADPTEAWDTPTTADGYGLLQRTLYDLSMRETFGFPLLPLTVVRHPDIGLTEDGLIGWLLKDYPVEYVDTVAEARTKPIILHSRSNLSDGQATPDLGGSYVGQGFVLTRRWDSESLRGLDYWPWWMQRRTRTQAYPDQWITLWVRQDVFESQPISSLLP